eukprot:SAG31_NODE_2370_length_5852_cov_2.750391_6_plen_72_part_00
MLPSQTLTRRRFGPYFIEPVIAGLNEDGSVYLCATDLIGAKVGLRGPPVVVHIFELAVFLSAFRMNLRTSL